MKRFLILVLISCFTSPSHLYAQPNRSTSWTWESSTVVKRDAKGVIQINIRDYVAEWKAPVGELTRALKRYPRANRFRVNWNRSNIGSASYSGTVLYIRDKKLVKVFSRAEDWESQILRQDYTFYTDVNDAMMQKIDRRKDATEGGGSSGGFSFLGDLDAQIIVNSKTKMK